MINISKNVDKNVMAASDSLFGFVENIFKYKCKLSQAVQYDTWTEFIKHALRFGLAALPIGPTLLKTITTFHHITSLN